MTIHPSDYAKFLALRGGMATCGQHLGVMVGPDPRKCPPGWVFLKRGEATAEQVQAAIDLSESGRETWPEKVSQ